MLKYFIVGIVNLILLYIVVHILKMLDKKFKKNTSYDMDFVMKYPFFLKGLLLMITVFFSALFGVFFVNYISGRESIVVVVIWGIVNIALWLVLLFLYTWKVEVKNKSFVFSCYFVTKFCADFNDIKIRIDNNDKTVVYFQDKKILSISSYVDNYELLVFRARKNKNLFVQ